MPWTGAVLPSLIGLGYPVQRGPKWPNIKQDSLNGKRVRFALASYPTYNFEIVFNILRSAAAYQEWQRLLGFINVVNGPVNLWGYNDPNDNTVTNQEFGEGDGATTSFQLVRTLGGFTEPVFLTNGYPIINVAGTPTLAYVISAAGLITFNSPPSPGAALTWTGSYYWPCRIDDDDVMFENFMSGLFSVKSLKFSSEKLDTVTGGTAPPAPSGSGVIDLSTGNVQPMLGGL
jgi:hypothetical protein